MHRFVRRGHQSTKLAFIGVNPIPITDKAPFVMEPYANGEKLRIELDGGAVGLDRLPKLAKTFECRAHIGVCFGEIRSQYKGLAISLYRLPERFLFLQGIAKIGVGF